MSSVEENKAKGFVVLYRSLLDWEYIDDDAVFSCFIKLLLTVNHKDKKWHGQIIERGSLICSIDSLSDLIRIKKTTLKRCLKLLSECGAVCIEVKPNKYHKITIPNYEHYQQKTVSRKTTNKPTDRATDKPTNSPTDKPTTTKQYNNINKETSGGVCPEGTHTPQQEENKTALPSGTPCGGEPSEPLSVREWRVYCRLKGYDEFRADKEWTKVRGVFTEGQKKKVREWLKSNGEPTS